MEKIKALNPPYSVEELILFLRGELPGDQIEFMKAYFDKNIEHQKILDGIEEELEYNNVDLFEDIEKVLSIVEKDNLIECREFLEHLKSEDDFEVINIINTIQKEFALRYSDSPDEKNVINSKVLIRLKHIESKIKKMENDLNVIKEKVGKKNNSRVRVFISSLIYKLNFFPL